MPSASTKPETKASVEVTDPIKQVIVIVEKKVRNLEKRKLKLDGYRQKYADGEELNADQKEAIGRYDGVIQSLELARELQKQFAGITSESEKQQRKQAKREKVERQAAECRRLKEMLQLQNLLDSLGSETARSDFINGNNGAVVLKEEELDKLDELYQLISPSREDNRYNEQLNEASEHMQSYLDSKDKEVAGTTYKALHDLVTRIEECNYFDNTSKRAQPEIVETQSDEEILMQEVAIQAEFAEIDVSQQMPTETTPVNIQENEPDILEKMHPATTNTQEIELSPPTEAPKTNMLEATQAGFEDSSFFSTVSINRPRQFKEIVSSVQGNFDFLQESQIELEHSKRAQSGFQNTCLIGASVDHFPASQHASQTTLTRAARQEAVVPSETSQHSTAQQQQYADSLSTSQATNDSLVSQQCVLDSYASAEQGFGQNHMNRQTTGSTHSFSDQASKLNVQMTSIDPSVVLSSADGPQPIPMPNETIPGQSLTVQGFTDTQGQGDQLSPDSQEKKPFSMNPNADIFRSMYPQQAMSLTQQQQAVGQMTTSGPPMPSAHDNKFYNQSMQSSDYQGGTFGGTSYVRGGGPRRGGQARASRSGTTGPANTFPRSGPSNRGGSASFNMSRGGGGNFPNSRGNNRGVIRSSGPPRGARGSNGGPNRSGYSRPNSSAVTPQSTQQA